MSRDSNDELARKIAFAEKYGVFNDDLGRSLIRNWTLGVCDDVLIGMIKSRIHKVEMDEIFGRLPCFLFDGPKEGDLILGKNAKGGLIRIWHQTLTAGLMLIANTGGGKTTELMWIVLQLAALGVKVWLSDMYKRQLRSLRPLFRKLGRDLIVLRPRSGKWNPLDAGSRNPRTHLAMIVDLLTRLLALPPRSSVILRQACHALYSKFSVWDGNPKGWPCLIDVYEWTFETKGLNASARESLLDRLSDTILSLTPSALAYRRAWQSSDLARHSIVYEMREVSESSKALILEPLIYTRFQSQMESGEINSPLSLFMAFEDSQRFFSDDRGHSAGGLPPMVELSGITRSSGLALCILAQSLDGLPRGLTSNMGTKIMGRLGDHDDYQQLRAVMAMTTAQIDWAKHHLQPGVLTSQVSEGLNRNPFPIYFPPMGPLPQESDAEVDASLAPLDSIPVEPATEYARWEPRHLIEIPGASASPAAAPAGVPNRAANVAPLLSDAEKRYLRSVVENPSQPSAVYARLSGMSGKRAADLRKKFVQDGLVREHSIARTGRGRTAIILEPLPAAFTALGMPIP